MMLVGNSNIACFNQQGLELAAAKEPVEVHWVGALQIDHFSNGHPAGARVRKLLSDEKGWKFLSIGTHDIFGLCHAASMGQLETYIQTISELYRLVFTQLQGQGKFGWLFFPQPLHQITFQGLAPKDIFNISRRFHKIISKICRELDIPVIAPLEKLVDKHGEPRKELVQRDGIHLNIEGTKIYIEEMAYLTGTDISFSSRNRLFEPASEVESFCSLLLDELRIPQSDAPVEFDFLKSLSAFITGQLRERGIDLEVDGETELVDSGLLDSLNLVETYTFAVELLKIDIPFDVDLRKLNTPSKISAFLLSRKKEIEGITASGKLSQTDFIISLRGDFNHPEQKARILEADQRISAMNDDLFRAFQEHVAVVSHGVSIRYCVILFWIALNKASREDYKSALEYLEASTDRRRAFPFLSPRVETYKSQWQAKAAERLQRQKFLWDLPVDASILTLTSNRKSSIVVAEAGLDAAGGRQGQGEAGDNIEVIIRNDDASREYLVTALVSTYNSERFIRECLEDLETQTIAQKVEIIVIDSASRQNERAIVEEFQKQYDNIVYVRTKVREKLYAAWNRGIRMAKGKYITNTNTDDRRLPYALEVEARALDEFPNAGLVYADIWGTTLENDILRLDDTERFRRYTYSEFTLLNGLTGSNFSPQPMWRRDVHKKAGFFDESYVIAGDYEFFFRIARQFNALHIKTPLGLYLENTSGIEKSQPALTREEFKRLRHQLYSEISLEEFFPYLSANKHDEEARGHALFELGNNCLIASLLPEYERAIDYYRKAKDILGEKPQLMHNMAIAQIGVGDTKSAIQLLKKTAKNLPASDITLKAIEKSAGNPRQLSGEACRVFFSEHPVAKSARQGLSIEPEKILSRQMQTTGSVHKASPVNQQFGYKEATEGMISIIILLRNQLDQTKKCIKSLRRHTPEPHEIIFVDNASNDGTAKWLQGQIKENKNFRLIENQENVGFAKGYNQGIEASQGEFILLLHNDVVVVQGWLSGMLECLNRATNTGIVGPISDNSPGRQQMTDRSYRSADYFDQYAAKFKEQYLHRRIPCRNIAGSCMLFKRTLAEKIGLLDERCGVNNFAEEDFCLRAALEGYSNWIAGDVFIHHDEEKRLSGNRQIFDNKWELSAASLEGKKLAILRTTELAGDLYSKGKMDQAVATLIECIKLTPEAKEIYYELARIFIESKKFSEAWEVIETMPDAAKNGLKGLELAGYAKEGLDRDDDAAAYAERMLSSNGNYTAALNLRGILAHKKSKKENAENDFKKAIDADHGYGEAYTNLGILYWGMDKKKEALSHLKKGFVLSPTVPDVSSVYYSVWASLRAYDEAETDFLNASKLYPQNKNIAFLYIDALIQQGKIHSAMTEIENTMSLFGLEEEILQAALAVREKIGPLQIDKTSNKTTLSVCMIVKNEERYMVNCLKSIRDIADEIIVVDTGSTDKTIDVARAFGSNVFAFPWTGDFSEARNHSLDQANGDWILVLDADEVISSADHKRLLKIINGAKQRPVAFDIISRNYLSKAGTAGWTENDGTYSSEEKGIGWYGSNKVRLIRNNGLLRFENPVHELLEASLHRAGIPIEKCDIPVHHYGRLDQDKLMVKGRDYYLLGRKKLEERGSGDYVALRELAVQAGELGIFEESIDLWQKALAARPDDVESLFNLGYHYMQIGKYREALNVSKRAVELSPETKNAVLNYALSEMFLGNAPKASAILEKFLSGGNDNPTLQVALGASYCFGGNTEKGLAIFRELAGGRIKNISYYVNSLATQLISSGQTEYAKLLIEAAIRGNIADQRTLKLCNDARLERN